MERVISASNSSFTVLVEFMIVSASFFTSSSEKPSAITANSSPPSLKKLTLSLMIFLDQIVVKEVRR